MLQYKKYVAGWLDSSIHDFLGIFPRDPTKAKFALVTCLDSNLAPKSLLKNPAFREMMNGAKSIGKGLLLSSDQLQDASFREQLFVGFDEICFFPSDNIEPKPESAWIVGPNRIDQKKLDKIGKWMAQNECSMALGDGDGLNIIVKAQGLIRYVLAHSMSQPEPTLQLSELIKEDTGEE